MDGIVLDRKADNVVGDSSNIYISLLLMPFFMLCPIWYIATFCIYDETSRNIDIPPKHYLEVAHYRNIQYHNVV